MRLVMTLKDADGSAGVDFFVDVVGGELRVRSAAKWDSVSHRFVEAPFDVVTQDYARQDPASKP